MENGEIIIDFTSMKWWHLSFFSLFLFIWTTYCTSAVWSKSVEKQKNKNKLQKHEENKKKMSICHNSNGYN